MSQDSPAKGTKVSKDSDPNALLLPAKKKRKKKGPQLDARNRVVEPGKKKKALSKAQKKRREKAIERKEKLEQRSAVLEELQRYQLSSEAAGQLDSFARIRQKAVKPSEQRPGPPGARLNSIKGARRKRAAEAAPAEPRGPYYETGSSSSEDDGEAPSEVGVPAEPTTPVEVETLPDADASDVEIPEPPKVAATPKALPPPTLHVPVARTPDVEAARLLLPILGEEQAIVEAVGEHAVVVITGATGSGKTTQVPQFLFEAGYTEREGRLIGVTEPRRVAAVSMAARIGEEMGLGAPTVAYQIRYEGNVTDETKIKLMTDGVLMKEIQRDIRLSRYSVIIIDEAHERSMYSDLLLGLLSRIVVLRARQGDPLKLIVMSATLRVDDFTQPRLFPNPPPVLNVEARQFPVTVHYQRRTPENYLEAAFVKVSKIHRELPAGGVLVFVSGQREVHTLIRWLSKAFPMPNEVETPEEPPSKKGKRKKRPKKLGDAQPLSLEDYAQPAEGQSIDLDEAGVGDDLELFDDPEDGELGADAAGLGGGEPLFCLPLYSLLPTKAQTRVFAPVPGGHRLCVVATNVAETSLTIPGVAYVVDCGKEKVRRFDPVSGVSAFSVAWASQASAEQRSGRAGRTGPGHAYRLYSSAVFQDFARFPEPEIMSKPVEELVLQLKSMSIVKTGNFPFPSAPEADALAAAEERLLKLGALERRGGDGLARISALGRLIALFPLKAGFGKVLALSEQSGLLPYAVALVAALSVREPLIALASLPKERILELVKLRRRWAGGGQSRMLGDLAVLLKAVGSCEFAGLSPEFCEEHGLRFKAMGEIRKLRRQLTNLLNANCGLKTPLVLEPRLSPPSEAQSRLLRQLILAGLPAHVARRVHFDSDGQRLKAAYKTMTLEETVYLDPSSVLYKEEPEVLVYQELLQTPTKTLLQGLCVVELDWLPLFAPGYCSFERPSEGPVPVYDATADAVTVEMKASYGPWAWPLGSVARPHPVDLDAFRWFGKALLEGAVVPELAKWTPQLLAAPASLTKSWSHLHGRNEALLNALVEADVRSKAALHRAWAADRAALWPAYKMWLPQSLHAKVESLWPFLPRNAEEESDSD